MQDDPSKDNEEEAGWSLAPRCFTQEVWTQKWDQSRKATPCLFHAPVCMGPVIPDPLAKDVDGGDGSTVALTAGCPVERKVQYSAAGLGTHSDMLRIANSLPPSDNDAAALPAAVGNHVLDQGQCVGRRGQRSVHAQKAFGLPGMLAR